MNETLKYQIALSLLPGVGHVLAKNLVTYCGSAEAVFREKERKLQKVPGIGEVIARKMMKIDKENILEQAEKELEFISEKNIQALFFTDEDYPHRMKHCDDSPVIIYVKGNVNLNPEKVLAVVGTRNATEYGKSRCEKIIEGLASENVLIISGLAYGIDITAHKAALQNDLPTVAVLAHGLDKLYPAAHLATAKKLQEKGGLLTEYLGGAGPDKENFPSRNRIVAAMADAVLVIESGRKGGSLITAEIAHSYNRDVFAVPGRVGDLYSEGCNFLIKTNKAALVESPEDIIYQMGWEKKELSFTKRNQQKKLFPELSGDEKILFDVLTENGKCDIDSLCHQARMTSSKAASLLLNLEFSGIVRSLPGKVYELV